MFAAHELHAAITVSSFLHVCCAVRSKLRLPSQAIISLRDVTFSIRIWTNEHERCASWLGVFTKILLDNTWRLTRISVILCVVLVVVVRNVLVSTQFEDPRKPTEPLDPITRRRIERSAVVANREWSQRRRRRRERRWKSASDCVWWWKCLWFTVSSGS